MIILLALLILLALPQWAEAVTRYVGTGGSDATSCAASADISTPKLTFASAIACMSAGDTLYIRAGTYSQQIDVSAKTGTAGNHITIAGYPGETVTIQSTAAPFAIKGTLSASNAYFTFKDMVLDGVNSTTNSSGLQIKDGSHDITLEGLEIKRWKFNGVFIGAGTGPAPTNMVIRNCIIHDQVSVSGAAGQRWYGIYVSQGSTVTIEGNQIYANPGGGIQIYPGPITGLIIRENVVYENNTLTSSSNPGVLIAGATNAQVYQNLIYKNGTTGAQPAGTSGLDIRYGATGTQVWNNTIYGNKLYGLDIATADAINTVVRNNIMYGNTGGNYHNIPASTTKTNNLETDPTFVNVSTNDYTLQSSSAAINAGVNVGLPYNGSAPDIGAFETFGFSSAKIDNHFLDVTLGMSANVPVLPSSGITGFTVGCTGTGCGTPTVASANKLTGTDSQVRLDISGITGDACAAGQTWTVSYTPGNMTDSALLGNSLNQSAFGFTTQAVTNVCTGSIPTDPSTPHIYYKLDEGTGTSANDESANNLDGTLTNSPTWTTGKYGGAVKFTDQANQYIAIGYGNAINPSTQSLTACMGVKPDAGLETGAQRIFFAAPFGTNQRWYMGWNAGFWGIGIQGSGFGTTGQFPVAAGWSYLCLVSDSGADTATLYVNGVAGTGSNEVKAFTSYTLAGNFRIGQEATYTINYGGSTVDEFKLYTSALSAADILDLYEAWEPPAPPAVGTFAQVTHRFQALRVDGSGNAISLGALAGSINVVPGGAFALIIQTDCTVADCDPISQRLHYNRNSGTFADVPDTFGAGTIRFYGSANDSSLLSGTVTCCLSGALTAVDGSTNYVSDAIPVVDLAQNGSTVQRYVLQLSSSAAVGDTYCFKARHQDGTALDGGYTPTAGACITVIAMQAGGGF